MKDPDPGPDPGPDPNTDPNLGLVDPDPDPAGPKTCGSGESGPGFGSGSATLLRSRFLLISNLYSHVLDVLTNNAKH